MTPREALDRIEPAILDLVSYNMELRPDGSEDPLTAAYVEGVRASLDAVRAVLAEVSPEPGGVLDRDALWAVYDRYSMPNDVQEDRGLGFDTFVQEVEAAVRTAAIDRDALGAAWDDGNAVGLDGWRGPGRGENIDPEAVRARERYLDRYAIVRPAPAGVTLTPEDVPVVLEALRYWVMVRDSQGVTGPAIDRQRALAARLEAAS